VITGDLRELHADDLAVRTLGPARHPSPMAQLLGARRSSLHWVDEGDGVLLDDTRGAASARGRSCEDRLAFEPGGPRSELFFDPGVTTAAIVTCGGLCPGLNNVIRGLVVELIGRYGVREVVGFRNGYRGLTPDEAMSAVPLTLDAVHDIQHAGGSVLGTSRGPQDPAEMLDVLVERGVSVLFVVGGDGSLRGAQGIADAAAARGVEIAVVGVPKTIDNDIPFLDRSFGFHTAFTRAAESIRAAGTEALSTPNGVGLVKLMGRHSGFIACYAALAHDDVDFVLIPEAKFRLDGDEGIGRAVLRRVEAAGHAIVVVAEGAGQDLLTGSGSDASGNARLADIGVAVRDHIVAEFEGAGVELNLLTSTRGTRSAALRPTATTPSTACGSRRPPSTRRWPVVPRWSSGSGTAGSSTSRWRWRPATAARSTRTATCGCRCSSRPASRINSGDGPRMMAP
jgi:6-phosphofructokinase 1